MLIGATNLNMFHPVKKAHLNIFKDTQWRILIVCIAGLMLIFFLGMIGTCPLKEAICKSFFQTVSAQSTSGFSTMDFAHAPALSKLSTIFSMSIGGSIGSTAGGIKIYRLIIFIKLLHILVIRIHQPREVITHLRINNTSLSREEIEAAIVSISLFILTALTSVTFFVGAGHNFLDSVFEVVSATGTVGLTTGLCCPDLSDHLKIILFFDMWMGRLEIFPFLILIYPRTWVKRSI
jgi:trk system potassium uptake protein TrkH